MRKWRKRRKLMTIKDDSESFIVKLAVALPKRKLTLSAPSFVFTNKPIKLTGTTEGANQQLNIMLSKGVWGIDWLARDETLKTLTSNGESKFETEITFEEVGMPKIYAAQKKGWLGIDWLAGDIKSPTRSIFVLDWMILGVLGALVLYIMYQRGMLKGIIKGGKK